MPFSFQIVGFHGTGAVVKCFEDRKENEHDLIFQIRNVRDFFPKVPQKIKRRKKGRTNMHGKSLDIQNNRILILFLG